MNTAEWRASRKPLLKPKDQPRTKSAKITVVKYVRPDKPKTWEQVWRWLKPRLAAAGRTGCEFGFLDHVCIAQPLDPVHAKKRRKGKKDWRDLYRVAIGCRNAHNIVEGLVVYKPFGRRVKQNEMEEFVTRAINLNGGLILP